MPHGKPAPKGKHRLAPAPRQPRGRSRRLVWLAAPLATVGVVAGGVVLTGAADGPRGVDPPSLTAQARAELSRATAAGSMSGSALAGASRSVTISRSLDRIASTTVRDRQWSTADLNLYAAPSDAAKVVGEFPSTKRIGVTGQVRGEFAQVVIDGQPRWVHADYLVDKKPRDPAHLGLTFSPCPATASVQRGLVPDAVRAWEAVCNAFPQVTTYGGVAARPEHNTGHAIDAMIGGDTALGYRIADFLQAHAAELNLYDIIFHQHIWTPVRASEGWRLMPDRGSATANHMDHVHFAVN